MLQSRKLFLNLFLFLLLSVNIGAHLAHVFDDDNVTQPGREFTNLYFANLQRLIRTSDANTEPCDDFFQHACGNWQQQQQQTSADSESESTDEAADLPPFLYNHEDRMHFFEEQRQNFATRAGLIVRDLYNDCKERTRFDVLSGRVPKSQWQRMLQEIPFLARNANALRQWPYMRHQWVELNRHYELDWIALAAELAAHGVPSFLNIFFAADTIYIAPIENLKCPNAREFKASLRPLLLPHRNPQIALIVGRELSVLCRQLSGQLPLSVEIGVNSSSSGGENATSLFVDDMTSGYFQRYFSSLNFSETEVERARKLPLDVARLGEVLTVMRTTEPRIIYNFLLWRAMELLKYEDCFLLTEEFEELLRAEYWQWYVFEPYFSRNVAIAIYLFHTTRFQHQRRQTLMSEEWTRFLQTPLERKDFNIERAIKNHANTFLDARQLSGIYDELPWHLNHFYANLLSLRRLRLRQTFLEHNVDTDDVNHPAYFLRHFLDFCIVLLKQPLFHYYATQGRQLWLESDLLYSSDGYYTALDCLERQSVLHADDGPVYRFLTATEVSEIFRFYSSFIESYRDYRFWLEGESFAFAEDFVLEYFHLNSSRIMFYAVAQQYCGRNDAVNQLLINRSFMNMPIFREAFNCGAEAPMNPLVKCLIRNCD